MTDFYTHLPHKKTAHLCLIGSFVAVFFLDHVANARFASNFFQKYIALSPFSIHNGSLWTLLTYAFLHHGWIHLLFNCLALHFIGDIAERRITPQHVLAIFLSSAFLGACLWLSLRWPIINTLVGASAGIMGLLAYICISCPQHTVSVLLFFLIPIHVSLRTLLWLLFATEGCGFLFFEVPGSAFVAHSAHLGGLISGVLYFFIQKHLSSAKGHRWA